MSDFPITRPYELGRLGQAGDEIVIAPSGDELLRIAEWAGIEAVEAFRATVDLAKISPTRYALDAELEADIVQSCVVTLEPVKSHIARTIHRDLFLTQTKPSLEIDVAPLEEDGREEIASLRYDLVVPVLEELALAIDPYPRAPGVEFAAPKEAGEAPVHPFAALRALRKD